MKHSRWLMLGLGLCVALYGFVIMEWNASYNVHAEVPVGTPPPMKTPLLQATWAGLVYDVPVKAPQPMKMSLLQETYDVPVGTPRLVKRTARPTRTPRPTKTTRPTKTPRIRPNRTATPTDMPTSTSTATSTSVASVTPTNTPTATPTSVPSVTPTPTATPMETPRPSPTPPPTPRPTPPPDVVAFPGAEGFGANSVGGRGGIVIEVTNLNDSGPGSLREAVEAEGPRIVVFRIGGTIELESCLRIAEPFITIAGQTAPGGGITLKNHPSYTGDPLRIRTNDVVIRYIRSRPGAPNGSSQLHALQVSGSVSHDIMIDHCSFSWGIDEVASITTGARNISLQWCILAEGLDCSRHPEGCHSAGPFLYYYNTGFVSYHHNVAAHSAIRQPYVKCQHVVDLTNNISYNAKSKAMHINGEYGSPLRANFVANYLKPGPNTSGGYPIEYRGGDVRMYFESNISPLRPDNSYPETAVLTGGGIVVSSRNDAPLVTVHPCDSINDCQAYDLVLAGAGATIGLDGQGGSYWRRDAVDERIINDVRNGTGNIIDDPSEVGGWPELAAGTAPADTDHDGMPDEWEYLYCLDPTDPADGPADADGDGYTNVEEYLNGTEPRSDGCSGGD